MSDLESTDQPIAKRSIDTEFVPRFGIRHLMLWTLCFSLYWALSGSDLSMSLSPGWTLLHYIRTGAVFAGMLTLIEIRIRGGPPLLKQPGHWLLLIGTLFILVGEPIVRYAAESIALSNSIKERRWEYQLINAVYLVQPIVLAFAVIRVPERNWKLLFAAMVMVDAPSFFYVAGIDTPGSPYLRQGIKLAVLAAMVVVSIVEMKRGLRRDWLHWTGVLAQIVSLSSYLIRVLVI